MKKIRYGLLGVLFCAMLGLLTGCMDVVSEPNEGDAVAPVLNTTALTTEQKLLETGISVPVSQTLPSRFGFETKLMVNNVAVDSFIRQEEIHFDGNHYTDLEGVITFRGDNYRSGAAYGVADMESYTLKKAWNVNTGELKKTTGKGEWTGSGWTGQPLIIRWPEETRKVMNLYDSKKNKSDLVEVIYATMDGNIYFLDLEDGSATRDKIKLGFPIKGTGSLYPDGTPLYVVGAGDDMGSDSARTFIVDLIQGKVIYEYGNDDEFSLRTDNGSFCAFDSSALFDVATDTLIQPGENGVLYTTKLNTKYDGASVSIDPSDVVKWNYTTSRTGDDEYWLGMESSAVVYDHYLYVCNNGGDLMCLDLNTMELVWSQDILDDSNASPVLEVSQSDGTAYIYISTSLHWTKDKKDTGDIPIFKINAATGEIVWKRTYECKTVDGVSGGVQATACLGQNNIDDLVYFNIARTGGKKHGKLVAIYKATGGEAWSVDLKYYSWSSPVAVYDKKGDGYIILCDSDGNMHLLDGRTGELKDTINLGKNVEASPAVFENTIVVGTRGKKIYAITLE
ncbi:MAG: PQQ-binding-like beta-propeller repeat protein [Lachnospiraceae bacterium]|nr:PQQ-binding-like beta-propeller repeat protein [Lachnospiraceae bacterium]